MTERMTGNSDEDRLNLLVVLPVPPYPVHGGFQMRYHHLLARLSQRHTVRLVAHVEPGQEQIVSDALGDLFESLDLFPCRPVANPNPKRSLWAKMAELFVTPEDYFLNDGYSAEAAKVIEGRLDNNECDVVLLGSPFMYRYFDSHPKMPLVVDVVDDPSVFRFRQIRFETGLKNRLRAVKEWLLVRRFVKQTIGRMKNVLLVSSSDARHLRRLCPNTKVSVVPLGVDTDYYHPNHQPNHDNQIIMFSGVMDYDPNVQGMLYFCDKVWPEINRLKPEVQLFIVGKEPVESIKALADRHPNITVTGFVEDMRDYFNQADIYVCPLVSGAGMKTKILEAWGMEKAIVATSLSCEGIAVKPGDNILIADKPEAMVKDILTLLDDSELRRKLGRSGRETVLESYSWDSMVRLAEAALRRAIVNVNG